MRKFSWRKKNLLQVLLILLIVIIAGFAGYCIYGIYKINQLSEMTFDDMLEYTTRDNEDAVLTVGIINNGNMTYKVYGESGIELPQEEHVYEIGSVTKTFTSSLLCKAVSEGRINLDDPIDKYIDLPKKEYYPTIRRLVTHTSGYKEYYFEKPMISNFLHNINDYNGITEEMAVNRLGKINLDDRDYSFRYSNFGMAILGIVLEEIYYEDYTELMNAYISDELGLNNTKISDGYGDLKDYWIWSESDAYMPAGALLSNITDMMQYVSMQIKGTPGYISTAHAALADVNASSAAYKKIGINIDSVGVGWIIDDKNSIVWHNGGTGNYNCYIGFNAENQVGVVILSNLPPNYRIPATVMGVKLLTSLLN